MTQILLIDSSIQDYEEVVKSVNDNTIPILYNKNYTFSDLSNAMTERIDRIGIFCHDSAVHDTFYSDVSNMIEFIQHHSIKQIEFLACNTLNNPEWVKYYAQLPCIVGATNTYTGNYGGDWIMQSTGENIESTYFSDIKYKHLLGLLTKEIKVTFGAGGYYSSGFACINNSSNIKTVVYFNGIVGQVAYTTITNGTISTNSEGYNLTPSIPSGITNCGAVYTSNNIFTADGTKNWVVFIVTGNKQICLWRGLSQSLSTPNYNTLLNHTSNFNKWNGIAIYNNKMFFSTGSTINTATIIDSISGTTYPSAGPSLIYINSGTTGFTTVSATYFPMQMTCDTNGLLYISMGRPGGVVIISDILVYNITGESPQYVKKISFNDVFSQVTYGYYYSLKWYNNILYIGTYIGTYSSSTTGYLFAYNTLTNAVKLYTTTITYAIAGIDIDTSNGNYLLTSALNANPAIMSSYNVLDTFTGFYYLKTTTNYGTYGIDSNSIVL